MSSSDTTKTEESTPTNPPKKKSTDDDSETTDTQAVSAKAQHFDDKGSSKLGFAGGFKNLTILYFSNRSNNKSQLFSYPLITQQNHARTRCFCHVKLFRSDYIPVCVLCR